MQELPTIALILIATFLASIGALVGGFILLANQKFVHNISHILTSFAAGALLAAALGDLLPEASEHASESEGEVNIFLWVLFGILLFYILERAIHWHHDKTSKAKDHKRPTVALIMLGDSMHNFIDGVAIAITFLVNPAVGFVTTLAVAAHEIPQEIGDFGVMLHEGLSRKKVLLFNIFSAAFAFAGALLAYFIGESVETILPYALSLTAGFFLYISLSSLIPEIHHEEKKGYALVESLFLFLGAGVVWMAITLLENSH